MRIRDYLGILGRRKWIVALVVVAAVIVAGAGSILVTPTYSASALVRLAQLQDTPATYYTIDYTERVANTSAHLLTSRAFLLRAIERLNLPIAPEILARSVRAEVLPNTELLRITVQNDNPVAAAQLANTLAALLVESGSEAYMGEGRDAEGILREQLDAAEAALRSDRSRLESLVARPADTSSSATQELALRVRTGEETVANLRAALTDATLRLAMLGNTISIIDEALPPETPIRPRPAVNLAMGLVLGGVFGVGLAFLSDNLDRRILSGDRLAVAGRLPVLGTVPELSVPWRARREAVLLDGDERAAAGEAFRMMRTVLFSGAAGSVPETLLVTSAEPRAGKSTLLANLAVALARTGRTVVAVDSDLRKPGLHRVFGVPNEAGFSNAVLVPESTRSTLRQTEIPGLRVLTSGTLLNAPAELLSSPNVAEVLRYLTDVADVVLLDSPPVLAATDAMTLAPLVGGVVVVVAQGKTTDAQLQGALEQLRSVGATMLGTVLNRAGSQNGAYGRYRRDAASGSDRRSRNSASSRRRASAEARRPMAEAKRH